MNTWQIAVGNVTKKPKPPKPPKMITCPVCENPMPDKLPNRMKRTYCSRACAAVHRSQGKADASR